jgi:hypothetical protein
MPSLITFSNAQNPNNPPMPLKQTIALIQAILELLYMMIMSISKYKQEPQQPVSDLVISTRAFNRTQVTKEKKKTASPIEASRGIKTPKADPLLHACAAHCGNRTP